MKITVEAGITIDVINHDLKISLSDNQISVPINNQITKDLLLAIVNPLVNKTISRTPRPDKTNKIKPKPSKPRKPHAQSEYDIKRGMIRVEQEENILNLLRRNKRGLSSTEVEKLSNLNHSASYSALMRLVKARKVFRAGHAPILMRYGITQELAQAASQKAQEQMRK